MERNQIAYFRIPGEPDAEFQVGANISFPAPGMLHDGFELGLVTDGRARFICEGRRFDAGAGDLVFIPRGEVHRVTVARDEICSFSVAHVQPRMLMARPDYAQLRNALPGVSATNGSAPALVEQFQRIRFARDTLDRASAMEEFIDLALASIRPDTSSRKPRRRHPALERAREALEYEPMASISLDALAAFAELSRYHFLREFRAHCGLTPAAYQLNLRILHGMRLLRDGRSPAEAADGSGFSSQSHFTRMFHRMLGTTPGAYRK